jgi:lipopolysaccharide biosynthesis glycosyltransferase
VIPAAFYCVADERYFLGAVAMINSLRLHRHGEPIFVLDAGLTADQRRLLSAEAEIVQAPAQAPPYMLKTAAPLAHAAEVMVLIDADMIVTRPLDQLIELARQGRVVAVADGVDRFVAQWGELLGTTAPLRRHAYVCSGLIAAGGPIGSELLGAMDEGQQRVDFSRTYYGSDDPGYPFRFPEQDILNAVVGTRLDDDQFLALDARLALTPPFAGIELRDLETLDCAFADGERPYVLHHHGPKPWLEPLHDGVYSRLLRRLLTGPGLAIEVPDASLPRRLRSGPLGFVERKRADARWLYRWYVRREPVATPREVS